MDTQDNDALDQLMPWSSTIPLVCRVFKKNTILKSKLNPHLHVGGDYLTLTKNIDTLVKTLKSLSKLQH